MIYAVTFNPSWDVVLRLPTALYRGHTYNRVSWTGYAGGKGNNVARAIQQLGGEVTAVGFYGGAIGDWIRHALAAQQIPYLAEPTTDSSRICLSLLDNQQVTEIRGEGPWVSPETSQALLRQVRNRLQPQDWVTISGSLPPGLSADDITQWVHTLRPHCQGIIADLAGDPLIAAWEAGVRAICPNRQEYEQLPAGVLSSRSQHRVITRGAEGVLWYPAEGDIPQTIRAPHVPVRNPVGAGDVLVGALVHALSLQQSWSDALVYAVRAASASVVTEGVAEIDRNVLAQLESP
ncbi:1-phosphofructokinase family hexose kinase [Sulfobacillus thermosulfidooxidans]|uniref:1-phosphofructokinase family hexose kinase n=1 Tax=Sulfobacillus thermosulfidooxidans TaxID=28034 RepID=UPI0006B5D15B|nr:PfkB family carbohydrate kinase [Sulfobacillus thermosulfidooxidans]